MPDNTLADDLLVGGEAIAGFLGMDPRRIFYHLAAGHIPATKCGSLWLASKARLRRHFTEEPIGSRGFRFGAEPPASSAPRASVPNGPGAKRNRQ